MTAIIGFVFFVVFFFLCCAMANHNQIFPYLSCSLFLHHEFVSLYLLSSYCYCFLLICFQFWSFIIFLLLRLVFLLEIPSMGVTQFLFFLSLYFCFCRSLSLASFISILFYHCYLFLSFVGYVILLLLLLLLLLLAYVVLGVPVLILLFWFSSFLFSLFIYFIFFISSFLSILLSILLYSCRMLENCRKMAFGGLWRDHKTRQEEGPRSLFIFMFCSSSSTCCYLLLVAGLSPIHPLISVLLVLVSIFFFVLHLYYICCCHFFVLLLCLI